MEKFDDPKTIDSVIQFVASRTSFAEKQMHIECYEWPYVRLVIQDITDGELEIVQGILDANGARHVRADKPTVYDDRS